MLAALKQRQLCKRFGKQSIRSSLMFSTLSPFRPHHFTTNSASSSEVLGECSLPKIAQEIEACDPVHRGDLVILAGTSAHRKGEIFLRVSDGQAFCVSTDDTYILVGLVAGERTDVVGNVILSREAAEGNGENVSIPLANFKYYMLPLTDPISYDVENLDWHTLLIVHAAVLRMTILAEEIQEGSASFYSNRGKLVLEVVVEDRKVTEVRVDAVIGILRTFQAVLRKEKLSVARTDRLIDAMSDPLIDWRCVKIALVLSQLAEEACLSGTFDLRALRHSRIVDDYIALVDAENLKRTLKTLVGNEFDDMLKLDGFVVTIARQTFDLREGQSAERRSRDHEKAGALEVPRINGTIRLGHVTLCRGRGTPLRATSLRKSYIARARRHVLYVQGMMLYSKIEIDMMTDLFFWKKIRAIAIGIDGGSVEMAPGRAGEPLPNAVLNGLLAGLHGPTVTRWLWAHIWGGSLKVHPSASKCYLGNNAVVSPDGYRIFIALSARAVGQCVTYYKPDTKKIYVDVLDQFQFFEVKAEIGETSHLVPADLKREDVANMRECVIEKIPDFCFGGHDAHSVP